MGFDETKRQAIRSMPKESKLMMVSQHLAKEHDVNSPGPLRSASPAPSPARVAGKTFDTKSPDYFVKSLQDWLRKFQAGSLSNHQHVIKQIIALRVSLTSQPIVWVQQFISGTGLLALIDLLHDLAVKDKKCAGNTRC
jgi:hypothetical protein